MKSYIIAIATFAAAVVAQSTSTNTAATATISQSPLQTCLAKCASTDVNCRATCVGVPHPGDAQVTEPTNCVANCDQGDGSAAATEKYAACQNACISSYIITSGTAAPGGAYTTAGQAAVTASAKSSSGMAASTGAGRIGGTVGSLGLVFAAFAML
ncbi:hypothetical protein BT63DRAFT_408376 [Microthyrium microscopicum]|uniref:Extracellular membrane protein CFEM domain-containing protein n=1 Tax=Microthyrium microscopicum TaxID=703497 RepID=A0A6A6UPG4_9PEZI|nr:hypothetical protein BT63DRAFT_408376 [Microthyrium microscopicum]